jgi:hypothetical protein
MYKRAIVIILMLLGTTACTSLEIETFKSLSPDQQVAVIKAIQRQQGSRDCYEAIDKHWRGDVGWARRVMWRESRNDPGAQNRSSTAAGCFQLLRMHDWRYFQVGCSPSDKYNADCNTKAAWHLFAQAGASPWNVA